MSEMASDDAHDELMCSMDVIAEVHAQDAEREQQRDGVSVGCVRPDGDGAGGDGGEAGRAPEGDEGGVWGCEGVDGVEQGASTAAREAEGDDDDEGSTTGLGPRGMTVRYCPSGSVSLNLTARGPF